jgi:sugar phosphate isomerase/epimerase
MINRRAFLKTGLAALAGTGLLAAGAKNSVYKRKIGIQLYSLRDAINKDLEGTLQKVANIGYNSLEAAGYSNGKFYGLSPKSFKSLVISMGMEMDSSHSGFEPEQAERFATDAKEIGCKYLVIPAMPIEFRNSLDGFKKFADDLNKSGEICKNAGIKLGYHNHAFEFTDQFGQIPFDILLHRTDKELVTFELDLYWIKKGGYSPVEYFRRFPQRFELWHVKDMETGPEERFAPVGQGRIDFRKIFMHKNFSGMKYFFVEQDRFYVHKPFESVTLSYNYLHKKT